MRTDRTRRPVLFLAWGERGHAWLCRIARALSEHPPLKQMMDVQALQFCAVGEPPPAVADCPEVRWLPAGAESKDIHQLLFDMLSERIGMTLDLRFDKIQVVERISFFDDAWVGRPGLRKAFAAGKRANGDPLGDDLFDLHWISLVDTVRPGGAVHPEAGDRIREALSGDTIQDVRLLIDMYTAKGSTVDVEMADDRFCALAETMLTSDMIFPREDARHEERSDILGGVSESAEGSFHPVSVLVLRHSEAASRAAFALRLWQAAASGRLVHNPSSVSNDDLAALVRADREALNAGRFDPRAARTRRCEVGVTLLEGVLRGRERISHGRDRLRDASDELRRQFPPLAPPLAAGAGASGVIMLQAGDMPVALWAVLAIGISALLAWLAARALRKPAPWSEEPRLLPPGEEEGVRRDWETCLATLETALNIVEREALPSGANGAAWKISRKFPHRFDLDGAAVELESAPPAGAEIRAAAVELLSLLSTPNPPPAPLLESYQRAAEGFRERTNDAVVRRALSPPLSAELVAALKKTPIMANCVGGVMPAEVLWMMAPALDVGDLLRGLESSDDAVLTRILSSDDMRKTTRVVFGKAVQGKNIVSLAQLSL